MVSEKVSEQNDFFQFRRRDKKNKTKTSTRGDDIKNNKICHFIFLSYLLHQQAKMDNNILPVDVLENYLKYVYEICTIEEKEALDERVITEFKIVVSKVVTDDHYAKLFEFDDIVYWCNNNDYTCFDDVN